ncbi:MAG: hypothetical protein J6V99_09165, partial [Neisseriaceae bacterium]|nr:hypothetical protein [Neisseriaceae bacterium]
EDQPTLEPFNLQLVLRQGDRKSNTVTINNFDAKTDVEIDSTTYADGKVTVKGHGEKGAKVKVTIGDQTVDATVGNDGQFTVSKAIAQTSNPQNLKVTAKITDNAGNTDSDNETVSIPAQSGGGSSTHSNQILPVVKAEFVGADGSLWLDNNSLFQMDSKGEVLRDKDGNPLAKEITVRGTVESSEEVKSVKVWYREDFRDVEAHTIIDYATYQKRYHEYIEHDLEVAVSGGQFEFTFTPDLSFYANTFPEIMVNIIATTETSHASSGTSIATTVANMPYSWEHSTMSITQTDATEVNLGGKKTLDGKNVELDEWVSAKHEAFSNYGEYINNNTAPFILAIYSKGKSKEDKDFPEDFQNVVNCEIFVNTDYKHNASAPDKWISSDLLNYQGKELGFPAMYTLPINNDTKLPTSYEDLPYTGTENGYMIRLGGFSLSDNVRNFDLSDYASEAVFQKGVYGYDDTYTIDGISIGKSLVIGDNPGDTTIIAPQKTPFALTQISWEGGNDTFVLNPHSGEMPYVYREGYNVVVIGNSVNGDVVSLENFNPTYDKIHLPEEIFTDIVDNEIREGNLAPQLLGSYLLFDESTGDLSYDFTGTGNSEYAITFAHFNGLLGGGTLTDDNFEFRTFTI